MTLASAKALHRMGANMKCPTTFNDYYMWRNRMNFFMRYTPEEKLAQMSVQLLGSVFDAMYHSMFREEHHIMQTVSYAYQDALAGIRGKADEDKILPNDANDDKLVAYMCDKKSFFILPDGLEEDGLYLKNFLLSKYPELEEAVSQEEAEVVFRLCPSIFCIRDVSRKEIYIDPERSCILDEEDSIAVQNYEYSRMLFIYMNQSVFLAADRRLRKEGDRSCKND